ncbi:MAG TPA: sigma-70 family RNA polymerase sigma factor [Pseudosphingobacterium sp.]|nr:sigma-70 family RNA polymerase sigma factor [Pseudosphingobacterium sp.]
MAQYFVFGKGLCIFALFRLVLNNITKLMLFHKLKKGDAKAFEAIYQIYWAGVLKACERYTGSFDDAYELTQEIFCSLWKRHATLRDDIELGAYLHQAAKWQSFRLLRDRYRHEEGKSIYAESLAKSYSVSSIELKELQQASDEQLELLPEPSRTIFLLSRQQQLTYNEIASQMNLSVKSIEYHMSKALKYLRRELHEHF